MEDINGNVSSVFCVDALDRPTQVIMANNRPALRSQKTFVYNDGATDRKITATSDLFTYGDNLAKTVSFYDKMGRTTETWNYKDNSCIISKQEYDALGRAYRQTNPYRPNETIYWTTSQFDDLGRVKKVITPDAPVNAEVNTTYLGNAVTVTDQAGKQRRSITNAIGQLKQVDEPDANGALAQTTGYDYDVLNNLTQVSQGIQTRTFVYDSLSRLKTATNPELGNNVGGNYVAGIIQYTYDDNGNLMTKIDARNVKTTYAYDDLNRVLSRTYTLSNGSPLPAELATPNVAYTYDDTNIANSRGKLTKVSSNVSETRYTAFDELGRVRASEQRTPFDPATETIANAVPRTSNYVYNLSGALIEQTYPSTRVVKNVLDQDGELALVQSKKTANTGFWNYAKSFTYTAAGGVSSMQLGNGKWESTQFNERLQPKQIALGTTQNGSDLLKLDYQYGKLDATGQTINGTDNGNVSKQLITVPAVGQTPGFTATQYYAYDELNRVKQASENIGQNTTWTQTFIYDRYGNRTFNEAYTTTLPKNCVENNVPIVCAADRNRVNPSASTTNNRLDSYTFDNDGNTTIDADGRTFKYDAENKQTEVRNAGNQLLGIYFYDGDGKRVRKYVPSTGETTVFVYDAAGKMVAEYATTIATSTEAKVSYLTDDHLGSPRISTDQNGAVIARHDYQPFGEEIARPSYGNDDVRKQFTGYEKDAETDLDFAQARYFKPSLGRFMSPDCFCNDTHAVAPQSWNLYLYVRNNPLKYIDVTGKELYIFASAGVGQEFRVVRNGDKAFKFVNINTGKDFDGKNEAIKLLENFINKQDAGTLDQLIAREGAQIIYYVNSSINPIPTPFFNGDGPQLGMVYESTTNPGFIGGVDYSLNLPEGQLPTQDNVTDAINTINNTLDTPYIGPQIAAPLPDPNAPKDERTEEEIGQDASRQFTQQFRGSGGGRGLGESVTPNPPEPKPKPIPTPPPPR